MGKKSLKKKIDKLAIEYKRAEQDFINLWQMKPPTEEQKKRIKRLLGLEKENEE